MTNKTIVTSFYNIRFNIALFPAREVSSLHTHLYFLEKPSQQWVIGSCCC